MGRLRDVKQNSGADTPTQETDGVCEFARTAKRDALPKIGALDAVCGAH